MSTAMCVYVRDACVVELSIIYIVRTTMFFLSVYYVYYESSISILWNKYVKKVIYRARFLTKAEAIKILSPLQKVKKKNFILYSHQLSFITKHKSAKYRDYYWLRKLAKKRTKEENINIRYIKEIIARRAFTRWKSALIV